MAKSTGLGLLELPTVFERLEPDVVITVGDRFETMATALAATYMNIPLAHTMGGEVSGNIDESIRHAVTKFAHVHFPACSGRGDRIVQLGEDPETVHLVGCPRIDLVAEVLARRTTNGLSDLFERGVGGTFTPRRAVPARLAASGHDRVRRRRAPDRGDARRRVQEVGLPAIVLWPNADAGSEDIARGIRKFREHEDDSRLHFFKNLPTDDYIRLMARTACLVGNSSSAIREGAFIGTPAVNIGTRQEGRQRGSNVVDVGYDRRRDRRRDRARRSSTAATSHEPIYGDGHAGERIADILSTVERRRSRSASRTEWTSLGLIPARGGSKGIPTRTSRRSAGKPLLAWTFEAALGERDADARRRLDRLRRGRRGRPRARRRGPRPARRSSRGDDTPMPRRRRARARELGPCDVLVLLQPTSPLRTRRAHRRGRSAAARDGGADSVVSVVEVPHQFRPVSLMAARRTAALVPLGPRRADPAAGQAGRLRAERPGRARAARRIRLADRPLRRRLPAVRDGRPRLGRRRRARSTSSSRSCSW